MKKALKLFGLFFLSVIFLLVFVMSALTADSFLFAPEELPSRDLIQGDFVDDFNNSRIIEEAGDVTLSSDSHWFLNSGGKLIIQRGIAETFHGNIDPLNPWRLAYSKTNPVDTENGYNPQNLFRLLTRESFKDSIEEVYFLIDRQNRTKSQNRNESNGVFLISRYQDPDNIYFVGLRIDGAATVKKKVNGEYFALSYVPIFSGYNDDSLSVLPKGEWVGLRSITQNKGNQVKIELFYDRDFKGKWSKVLEVIDDGKFGPPHLNSGQSGIRTDFMDVSFDNYRIQSIR